MLIFYESVSERGERAPKSLEPENGLFFPLLSLRSFIFAPSVMLEKIQGLQGLQTL